MYSYEYSTCTLHKREVNKISRLSTQNEQLNNAQWWRRLELSRSAPDENTAETVRVSCCVGTPTPVNASTTEGRSSGNGESESAGPSAGVGEMDRQTRAYNSINLTVYARVDRFIEGFLGDRNKSNSSGTSQLMSLIAHVNTVNSAPQ